MRKAFKASPREQQTLPPVRVEHSYTYTVTLHDTIRFSFVLIGLLYWVHHRYFLIVSGALLLTWLTRGTALPRALAAVLSVSLFLWLWASPTLFGQTVESYLGSFHAKVLFDPIQVMHSN